MILDGMPDQTGNRTTLLLEAGNKTIVAQCIDVKILHGHVSGQTDRSRSDQIPHEPGREGHNIIESQMIEILNDILEQGQSGIVHLAATGEPSSRGTIPNDRNTHEAHPAERDSLVGEKINDCLAVRDSHVERDKVGIRLHHLAPEKLLLLEGDIDEIPIRADGGRLGGWDGLEIHRSLDGSESLRKDSTACCHGTTRSTSRAIASVATGTTGATGVGKFFVFNSHWQGGLINCEVKSKIR